MWLFLGPPQSTSPSKHTAHSEGYVEEMRIHSSGWATRHWSVINGRASDLTMAFALALARARALRLAVALGAVTTVTGAIGGTSGAITADA
jgi:hypothetical protein